MKRIQDIPLTSVLPRFAKVTDITQEGANRHKCTCPFHNDSHPSLMLYDKTQQGKGWDYHCYSCGAHGTALTVLTSLGLAQTEDEACDILRREYNLTLPEKVSLTSIADFKGLDKDFLAENGWASCDEGVEIPFLDRNGNVMNTKVRTKFEGKGNKFFFRGTETSALPYGLHWIDAYEDDIIYIAEGETDTCTLRQAGFPALGIAGARGFKDDFAPYLKRFKSIVVVKDNDEAGWQLVSDMSKFFADNLYMMVLPPGVKDINNLHQYRCNSQVDRFTEEFNKLPILPSTPSTFIAAVKSELVMPTEKACWDMVVRCLPTKSEQLYFKEEFCKATKATKSLVNECLRSASKPRSEMERSDGEFIISDGCYYKEVFRGDAVIQVRITNFVVHPKYDIEVDGEIIRVVTLENCEGRVSPAIYFDSESLASTTRFNQKCLSAGNYIFTGDQTDLFCMCYTIFNVPKETVYSPKKIGRINHNNWLFANCGIDSTGAVVPISDGIVRLDGVAYKPRGITISDADGDTGNSGDMPTFDLSEKFEDTYLADLARAFTASFGTQGALVALGWAIAGWFSDDIFSRYGVFPHLFVTGRRASGKSVFCTLLQSSFGFSPNNAGMSIESPTNVGIMRYLDYRASLPQWYDDYRNGIKRIQMKDNLLLDAYNRHGSVKGRKDGGVSNETVNGFLLLSGEDVPANNALMTRCSIITLSVYERDDAKYEQLRSLFDRFPSYSLRFASDAALGKTEELFANIDKVRSHILTATRDAREALNRGILAGAFLTYFDGVLTDDEIDDFLIYCTKASTEQTHDTTEAQPMQLFFDEFPLYGLHHMHDYIVEGNEIWLRMAPCHFAWQDKNRADLSRTLSQHILTKYIRKEPFFAGDDRKYFDGSGRQRCIKLDLAKMPAEQYSNFIEYISAYKNNLDY